MPRFLTWIVVFFSLSLFAQNYQDKWRGHFSYVSIKDIYPANNKVYVAAENAIFTYDLGSGKINTISTINGLTGEFISAIHYNEKYKLLIVGYQNGMMDIIKEGEKKVLRVVDIFEKQSIPPDRRYINDFYEYKDKLYISTKYGISIYDLARLEFGDTYFIGNGGTRLDIVQVVVQEPYIFAASENNGILRALVDDDNLIDYQSWNTIVSGNFKTLSKLGDRLYAGTDSNAIIQFGPDGNETIIKNYPSAIKKFRTSGDLLTVTTSSSIHVYGPGFALKTEKTSLPDYSFDLLSGNANGTTLYIGTNEEGLLVVPFDKSIPQQVLPNGPIKNRPFALDATAGQLWVAYGETDIDFNPYPLRRYGVSYLKDTLWYNISYKDLSNAVGAEPTNLMKVTINPQNPKEVYMSSFQKGLLKIVDKEPKILYDETNSPLEKVIIRTPNGDADAGIRIFGSEFDKEGNLWFVQSKTDKGLIRLTPGGQFQKVDISNYVNPITELALTKLTISRENYVFFGSYGSGLFGYNPSNGVINKIGLNAGNGNLPSTNVRALAIDAQNRLWIGTLKGLRLIYSPSSFFQAGSQPESQPIIIVENGVGQELLYQQSITAIVVDGSNNIWISTASSGVFYLSSDGQQTLLRFTKDNSPLPTNNVQDIAVDPFTGTVYFATTQGLVSYKGTATAPGENLSKVHAFPNPVRPGFQGNVTIDGLTAQANVKITDISGNLVFETISKGGSVTWDTTAFGRYKVRSGVYLVLVTTQDNDETKVSKIMIVR